MRRFIISLLFLCFSFPLQLVAADQFVEIIATESLLLKAPSENAEALFKSKLGNQYLLLSEEGDFAQVSVFDKQSAWIKQSDIQLVVTENLEIATDSIKVTEDVIIIENLYTYSGQENYRFPSRSSNKQFDLDIDGFYEVKASGRNYNPKGQSSAVWKTITNDPVYKKIPRDVLLGPLHYDLRSQVSIQGKLSDDLYVYYDIQQDPDLPNKYDVKVDYKDHHFQFFHLDAVFQEGEYLNVNKSLRGAKYDYTGEHQQFKFATGKERSNSKVIQNFGTGKSVIKLNDRFIYPGSLRVYVNNKKQAEGSDYEADYYQGEVTFSNPVQSTDYYKIIYEASNPISDYLPVLARRSFMGVQYSRKAEKVSKVVLTEQKASERFSYQPFQKTSMKQVTFNKRYLKDPIFKDALAFKRLTEQLIAEDFLTKDLQRSFAYSPEMTLSFITSANEFALLTADIKNALDLFSFDVAFANKDYVPYSDAQLLPESLSYIEQISYSESVHLWQRLLQLRIINAQGYLRKDLETYTTLFGPKSPYFARDTEILEWLKQFLLEGKKRHQHIYILKHRPVVLGSETIKVNDLPLKSLSDYFIDYSLGTLSLQLALNKGDEVEIDYNYYNKGSAEEEFIGNYSKGPYRLEKSPVMHGSASVFLNNRKLRDIEDYIVHYDTGEIYFNFEVPFPTIVTVKYDYIQSEEVISKEDSSPLEYSAAFVREFMPTGEENIISSVSSENPTVIDNIISLTNVPLTNTENLKIAINDTVLTEDDYTIVSTFKSQIEITTTNFDLDDSSTEIDVSYDYINSFRTTFTYYINEISAAGRYNTNWDQFVFTELPFKFGGISYIKYHDSESGDDLYLEEGISFEVENYGRNEDGNSIAIAFKQRDVDLGYDESILDDYPKVGDSFTIVYDYTPDVVNAGQDIVKQMFAANVRADLNDEWAIDTEVAVAGNNFGENILDGSINDVAGTGIDGDDYSLGASNIVEESESVFLNGYSQTKNEDYTINYKSGTITFRDWNPTEDDRITVVFRYYQTGAETASESMNYSVATKLAAEYKSPSMDFKSTFKYIDQGFDSVGSIQEEGGSTVIDNAVTWQLSPTTSLESNFGRRSIFLKESTDSSKIYKNQNSFDSIMNTVFLDRFKTKQSLRYQQDVSDPDPDNSDKRAEDSRVVGYESDYKWGNNVFSLNTSRKESDYKDQLDYQKETTQVLKYTTIYDNPDVLLLGDVNLKPTYYRSYAQNTYQSSPTSSFKKLESYKLSSVIKPIQNMNVNASVAFEESSGQTSSTADETKNQSKSYGATTLYTPVSWLSLTTVYKHDESLSPLLDQASNINRNNSFSVNKFIPYYALQALGVNQDNPAIRPFKKSQVTAKWSGSQSISNNDRKETETAGQRYGINEIGITDTLVLAEMSYAASEFDTDNTVPQSNTSRNISLSESKDYAAKLKYTPKAPVLRYMNYAYSIREDKGGSESTSFATTATGDSTIGDNLESTKEHVFTLKPPQLRMRSLFNRDKFWRVGSGQYSLKRTTIDDISEIRRYKVLPNSTDTILDSISIDNEYSDKYVNDLTFSPFNMFTINAEYVPEEKYLNRDQSNYTGSTFQDKEKFKLSTGFSPLSFLSFNFSTTRDGYNQYRSPSANVSEEQLKEAYANTNSSIIDSFIGHESISYSSSATLRKYFLGFTGTYSTLAKEEEDFDADINEFDQESYSGRLDFYFFRGMNLNYTYKASETSFSNTTEGGTTQTINFNWAPLKKTYSKIYIDYSFIQTTGFEFNEIQQDSSVQGDGDFIETQVIDRDDVVQKGSLNVSVTFPLNQSPYLNKFVFEGEGYLKSVSDKKVESNDYDISGLLFKGTLFF